MYDLPQKNGSINVLDFSVALLRAWVFMIFFSLSIFFCNEHM